MGGCSCHTVAGPVVLRSLDLPEINMDKTPQLEESMKPTTLNILGIDYSISYVDKPSDVDIHGHDVAWGQIDYWTRSIRIYDKNRGIEDIWQTLMHEILHAIGDALHLKINEEEMHDELDILAVALTDVLMRNGIMKVSSDSRRSRTKE